MTPCWRASLAVSSRDCAQVAPRVHVAGAYMRLGISPLSDAAVPASRTAAPTASGSSASIGARAAVSPAAVVSGCGAIGWLAGAYMRLGILPLSDAAVPASRTAAPTASGSSASIGARAAVSPAAVVPGCGAIGWWCWMAASSCTSSAAGCAGPTSLDAEQTSGPAGGAVEQPTAPGAACTPSSSSSDHRGGRPPPMAAMLSLGSEITINT